MSSRFRRLVVWFRRDLRLHDNPALHAACSDAESVVPVAVVPDDEPGAEACAARSSFADASRACLDAALREHDGRLTIRQGDPVEELPRLVRELGAEGLYHERAFEPMGLARDAWVRRAVEAAGGFVREHPGRTVHDPDALRTSAGRPFTVFTAFYRAWLAQPLEPPLPAPDTVNCVEGVSGLPPATHVQMPRFEPGERAARSALARFVVQRLRGYASTRDELAAEGTSRLSVHLRVGTISAREVVWTALGAASSTDSVARESVRVFVSELAWRDFYHHVLHHHPHVAQESFRPALRDIAWADDDALRQAWQEGRTGYPLVDAAMRQLHAESWMHNRARMVTASFLSKDLLVDWRRGEGWFMRHLADGDLAANNGGWQWSAGTGTDAQPFFRVFSPVVQGRRFDPDGAYVRRYVPELERAPTSLIHEPWRMSASDQAAAGCRIGRDYPAPVVDHARQRLEAVRLYREAAARHRGDA
ncbi:MAG TPA: deoxyribodipyrimidine photo-lyase [Chthonomonadales bacterium]|nr:deoxyribodipyrimidine photo-lyase [Chthonomonadales bacterium]